MSDERGSASESRIELPSMPYASDPRFRCAFLQAPIGMVLLDGDGRISLANDAFGRMLGYQPEELVGLTYVEITHPDDRSPNREAVEAARAGSGILHIPQKRYVRRDGSFAMASVHVNFLGGEGDGPTYMVAQVQDISPAIESERALRRSHARLEHAQRIARLGSWEVDLRTGEVSWSAELYRIYGVDPETFVPDYDTFLDRVHEDQRDEVQAIIDRIREGVIDAERPLALLHQIVRPDGSVRSLATEGRVEHDREGRPARMVGTTQDVTAREVARQELERRVHQQDALAELARQALESSHIGELLQHAVDRATETLEADRGELLELLPGGSSVLLKAAWGWDGDLAGNAAFDLTEDSLAGDALEKEAPVRVDRWATESNLLLPPAPAGPEITSSLCVPVPGPEGSYGALCVHSRHHRIFGDDDVRFLESVAVLLATALERKETERELVRRDEQLVAAQRLEAIARLVGGVSHDFNNLLLVITGFAGLLESRISEDDDRRKEVQAIVQAAQRASALTRKLLAFSGKQMMQPRVVNLNAIITDVQTMLERALREDIEIVSELEEGLGNVRADPVQVEQVLMNLAVNARDAMPDGGRIRIVTRNEDLDRTAAESLDGLEAGRHVLLSLEDTGCGMDEDTMSQVFEPFFTTKPRDQGTGLGLATVYGIVKQTSGDISIRSGVGQGTRVDIHLPRVDEPADGTGSQTEDRPVRGGTETILVVEDEEAVRDLAARFLQEYGYRVIQAEDAEHALRVARDTRKHVHLLLTDVVMPHMSGPELAMRARSTRPGLKVLFMSGYAERPELVDEIFADDAAFLRKPFRAEELARHVRRLLESRSAPAD